MRYEAFTANKCAKISGNIELKTNISEISLVTSIRVSMVNGHMLYQYVKLMPLPAGVLCSRKAESYSFIDFLQVSPCSLMIRTVISVSWNRSPDQVP
jgi:hypothetical protein